MGTFSKPVDAAVLAALDPAKRRELAVWSSQHSVIFDLRLHSIWTCPFLAYIPAYASKRGDITVWANWLHDFFGRKHQEEKNLFWRRCNCAQQLGYGGRRAAVRANRPVKLMMSQAAANKLGAMIDVQYPVKAKAKRRK